jgi:hypothetical protein
MYPKLIFGSDFTFVSTGFSARLFDLRWRSVLKSSVRQGQHHIFEPARAVAAPVVTSLGGTIIGAAFAHGHAIPSQN